MMMLSLTLTSNLAASDYLGYLDEDEWIRM